MQNQEEEMNIADIDVEDVDDMNETDEDSDQSVEDVDLIEDSENIVTNDLEYISHFVDIPVIAPKEDIIPTLSNQQNRDLPLMPLIGAALRPRSCCSADSTPTA